MYCAVLERDCTPHYFNHLDSARLFLLKELIKDAVDANYVAIKWNSLLATNEIADFGYIDEIFAEDGV